MNPDQPPPSSDLPAPDPGELLARALRTHDQTGSAGAWTPPEPEEMQRLLPQYEIEKLIGHGGMGAVYQGRQPSLDRAVAIKLLPAEMAGDAEFVDRFRREARMLAKLQHPGIVAVHDFGQTGEGHLYFVMEYVDGTDLHQVIGAGGLKPEQALGLTVQICEALQFAHAQGVIHRDIKPANILLTRDGHVKLADFGLARPLRDEVGMVTKSSRIMGTPDYMAPEQREGRADHRSDIYALGVMLYEMLTGQRPQGAFRPPSQKVRIDVRLDGVVLRALQQEPERRYQAVEAMRTDVERIRTTPVVAPPRVGKKKPRSKAWLAWTAAALALVAGGGWLVQRQEPPSPRPSSPVSFDFFARDLCFLEDDWSKGIPLLAVNGGPFQDAATAEKRFPGEGSECELARQWLRAASRVEAPDRWHCFRRARSWFSRALDTPTLQRDVRAWNDARAELARIPVLHGKLRMTGRSYFRERLHVSHSALTWFSEEAGDGHVELTGEKSLPAFSLNGGGTKSRAFSREERQRLLPEGLDFTTAKLGNFHFGAKTGSVSRILSFQVLPNGKGVELNFGEVNAAKVRYPGNFTFDVTLTFGEDGVGVPTPMPANASAAPSATPAPAPPTPTPQPLATPTKSVVIGAPSNAVGNLSAATPSIAATPTPGALPITPATVARTATPAATVAPWAAGRSSATPPPALVLAATPIRGPFPSTPVIAARTPSPAATIAPATAKRPPVGVPADAVRFGDKWYRVYLDKLPWNKARDHCWQLGGRLAMPQDEPTNAFVQRLADGREFWLGAFRERGKTEWFWLDGKPMKFNAWIKGEPNLDKIPVQLRTWRGGWADDSEWLQLGYICEWQGR